MKTIRCADYAGLSRKSAALFAAAAQVAVQQRGNAVAAIPGGRSVTGMLQLVADAPFWKQVHLFLVDERMVSIDSPESNYQQTGELLIRRIPLIPHPFLVERGVAAYSHELKKLGNHLDVAVVAAGEDGHIAGLFPRHRHLQSRAKGYLELHDSPKPPPDRVTASPRLIQDAGCVILLFAGAAKQQAYAQFINPDVSPDECPAKLAATAKDLTVLVCP